MFQKDGLLQIGLEGNYEVVHESGRHLKVLASSTLRTQKVSGTILQNVVVTMTCRSGFVYLCTKDGSPCRLSILRACYLGLSVNSVMTGRDPCTENASKMPSNRLNQHIFMLSSYLVVLRLNFAKYSFLILRRTWCFSVRMAS